MLHFKKCLKVTNYLNIHLSNMGQASLLPPYIIFCYAQKLHLVNTVELVELIETKLSFFVSYFPPRNINDDIANHKHSPCMQSFQFKEFH